MKTMQQLLVWGSTISLAVCGSVAHAHNFQGALPSAAGAYSKYSVTCYNNQDGSGDTAKYVFQIQGVTAAAPYHVQLSMQKQMDNGDILQSDPIVDPVNGDNVFSSWGQLNGGNGTYVWTISKVASGPNGNTQGPMVFSVTHHCQSATGAHTGTDDPVKLPSSPVDPSNPGGPPAPVDPTKPTNPLVSSFSGSLSKLATGETVKRYRVTCATKNKQATFRYWFSIRGATKNRPFLVQLTGAKGEATEVVNDPNNNDKAFGKWAYIEGGDGPYILSINKEPPDRGSTRGSMAFKVNHTCEAESGLRTKISAAKAIR
jgi:hypothetical protein